MDLEQAALRLARRRRVGRQVGIATLPALIAAAFLLATSRDGALTVGIVVALGALAAAVSLACWWLERRSRRSRSGCAPRRGSGPTPAELDDARAEVALRTCSPPPPGGRARLEALVARWSRDARRELRSAPVFAGLGVLMATVAADESPGNRWLGVLWGVMATVQLVKGLRRREVVRRWTAAHDVAPEVAGRP